MAAPEDIREFLEPVVAQAAELMQITDAEGNVQTEDPIVALSAQIAYGQLVAYCNRPFIQAERREVYDYFEPDGQYLRCAPVKEVALVETRYHTGLTTEWTALDPDYWDLDGDKLTISAAGISYTAAWLSGEERRRYQPQVRVTYTGGYEDLEDDGVNLTSGLVVQTAAVYHRRDLLGFKAVTSDKGTAKVPTDAGEVVHAAGGILEPFIYYGQAEEQ